MAAAAIEAAFSIFYPYPSPKSQSCYKSLPSLRSYISASNPTVFLKSPIYPLPLHSTPQPIKSPRYKLRSTLRNVTVEEDAEQTQKVNQKRKLFVLNLPWSFSVVDIKNFFGECGTVADVEIIKQKDGRSRGFAFVTMASGEEAQAVIDKFDSSELSGRIIRVEFAKKFKKPSRSPPAGPPPGETRHKLYVSNLEWKVRSNNLREFFSADFNPVSARVVFDSPSGRSAGYGFVSFATKEEAESAISSLDGKELLGRPISLKLSEKNADASENDVEETNEEAKEA
ncbi:RNA-binding (RRM/RBD/RNP motif) family protein [Forsythia ovata]|uniref:RNA-binding (RRM/RBD/RNP motif) family protein n=1 Tax=Forsythia ovata TaxID=205694 RepID=A0ABD1W755_9LAMI